jgi:hypothetical protein
VTRNSGAVKALWGLVERRMWLTVGIKEVGEMFGFGNEAGELGREVRWEGNKRRNSLAVKGEKTVRVRWPVPKERKSVGSYSVCVSLSSIPNVRYVGGFSRVDGLLNQIN